MPCEECFYIPYMPTLKKLMALLALCFSALKLNIEASDTRLLGHCVPVTFMLACPVLDHVIAQNSSTIVSQQGLLKRYRHSNLCSAAPLPAQTSKLEAWNSHEMLLCMPLSCT